MKNPRRLLGVPFSALRAQCRFALAAACLFVAFGLSGCKPPPISSGSTPAPDILGEVPDFSLTDQEGRQLGRNDLRGRVWVASFIFARCATVCPQVCGTLARLQKETADRNDLEIVSFSVNPENDTPAVLKKFAQNYGADSKRWHFLTGPEKQVYDLIGNSFQLAVAQNRGTERTPGNEVTHSSRLVLIDRAGRIRSHFDGRQTDETGRPVNEVAALKEKVDTLLREGR